MRRLPLLLLALALSSPSSAQFTGPEAAEAARPLTRFVPAGKGGVLLIGDSLTVTGPDGGFGRRLVAWLSGRGYDAHVDAGSSGWSEWWLTGGTLDTSLLTDANVSGGRLRGRTRLLSDLLALYPDTRVVIINLGTNELRRGRMRELALQAVGPNRERRCYWIGPPHMSLARFQPSDVRLFERRLRDERPLPTAASVTELCGFISSLDHTPPYRDRVTGFDGVHYSRGPSEAWADSVAGALAAALP